MKKTIEIYNLSSEGVSYCESTGLAKCWNAYAEYSAGETINMIGFNDNSGYVYIALENGVQIACAFGRDVEYIVFGDSEEKFFDSYQDAVDYMNDDEEEDEE